jgi:hypothetical protein
MCLTCSCNAPFDAHQDARNITMLDLQGAADAQGTTPLAAAENLMRTVDGQAVEKGRAPDATLTHVVKSREEQRYVLVLAYPAMKRDVGRAKDGKIDFVRPEVVEKAAWNYMAGSRRVGISPLGPFTNHGDGTEGHAKVVESYIYRGPDWTHQAADGTEVVIKSGDWLVGLINDEVAWPLWKSGVMTGASPLGTARRRNADPADMAALRS